MWVLWYRVNCQVELPTRRTAATRPPDFPKGCPTHESSFCPQYRGFDTTARRESHPQSHAACTTRRDASNPDDHAGRHVQCAEHVSHRHVAVGTRSGCE